MSDPVPSLNPLALFATLLCILLLVERFVNAMVYTALYILVSIDFLFFNMLRNIDFQHRKSTAGISTLRTLLSSCLSFLFSVVSLCVSALSTLTHYALTGIFLLTVIGFFFLWTDYAGEFMLALSDAWNSTLGPSAQILVIWPLRTFAMLFDAVVPIWNAVIWIWKKVPYEILVRTVAWDLGTLVTAAEELVGLCRSLAISLLGWIGSFICCDQGTGANPLPFFSEAVCNPKCLDPGNRVFDLLEPMAHVRHFMVYAAMWLKDMCACMAGPIDLLTYPFMDINFAEGVHFTVNSVLFAVTHLPALTAHRCTTYGAESLVMCIPDIQPPFQMLVAGLRSFGLCIDNWLDVLVLIVQASLGKPLPDCISLPAAVADVASQAALFGSNATVIAGMTNAMFARTDGVSVQYFSLARDWQMVLHPDAFPFPVDVSYGVAAIAHISDLHHDAKGDDTMALLGCACADTDSGLAITCGAAVFDDQLNASRRIVPVEFQLASTAQYMACSKLVIKVQSLRWPATRTTSTKIVSMDGTVPQDPTCVNKGTCLQADAAIWIRPMCAVDSIDLACVRSFTASGCFPYCMALHVRGSGTQPMIIHNADEWDAGVTMLARDCGLYSLQDPSLANATTSFRSGSPSESTVLVPGSPYGLNARTPSSLTGGNCTYNPSTISIQPRPARYVSYNSLTLSKQPFAFVGDLALVALQGYDDPTTGEPTWYIEVQRLFGDQANEFTVIPLAQYLPSAGPCTTPANCGNVLATCSGATGCLPAVPYSWDTHPRAYIPGTVTDRYAFYLTNPDLQPFEAFSYYCVSARTGRQATNKFQISAISSYGGIRLWRLDPYLYCPVINGRHTCRATGSAGSIQIQALNFTDFDVSVCTQEFAVFAVGLDYVNQDNLALTVMRTTLDNIDTRTLEPLEPSRATYPVIWVNPNTLQWQEGRMWMPEAASPALIPGQLCPSQRRTPNVGSMYMEAVASIVLFVRLPLNIVLGMPVIMPLVNQHCPLITRGHWLLQTCGAELVSLDDFFNSVYRLNSLFFQSFAIVADAFGPGTPQTFINGMAMAGENGAFPQLTAALMTGFAKQITGLGTVDPLEGLKNIQNSMGTLPTRIQMAKQLTGNPISRAHYLYTVMSRMFMKILQAAGGTATIGNVFWTTLADSLDYHSSVVEVRNRRICEGLALSMGYTSPVAMVFNRWCNAFVSLEEGLLTMLAVFTVEIPLMACICKESQGYNFRAHVVANCFPDCPDLYKPLVVQLLARYSEDPSQICPYLVSMSGAHFTTALDRMFSEISAGNRQLASVIDSFIVVLDSEAGDCNNFQDNPYVITLVPEPVDYFRVCGLTSNCRNKCLSEFQAFEALNVGPPAAETVVETVQSPLFAALDKDAYNPLDTAFAMIELASCSAMCGNGSDAVGDRCFLLAGTDSSAQRPTVMGFCVPIDVGAGVRRAGSSILENFPQSTRAAPILQAAFVWRPDVADDFWAQYRFVVMTSAAMYQCGHYGPCATLYALTDLGPDVSALVSFVAVGNTLVQRALYYDGVLPSSTSTRIYSYTLIEFYEWAGPFDVTSTQNLWPNWDYSYVVCMAHPQNLCSSVLFVPFTRAPGEDLPPPVQICARAGSGDAFVTGCVSHDVAQSFIYQAEIPAPSNPSARTATVFAQTGAHQEEGTSATWSIFMTLSQTSFWLKVVSIAGSSGAASPSLPTSMRLTIHRPCSIQNCVGCSTLAVQQVCYAAQQCQVARCIGTMVHMRRPLCAIGMTMQALVEEEMSLVQGAWLVLSQTMVQVLRTSTGGVQLPSSITWPDQAFYGFVCNAKDVSATALSILVSSINGVVLTVGESPVVEASLQTHNIDNRAFALFTMTSAATTNFLHQIALGPLYMGLAVQKTMICTANSVLSTVGVNSITIGDPAIQSASDNALGRCMSQYATENTQGGATGVQNSKALSASAVGALAMSAGLDYIMHPLDAAFTWIQGCISGLQDVVETLARSRCVRAHRRLDRRRLHRVAGGRIPQAHRRHDHAPAPGLGFGPRVVALVDVLGEPAQAPRAHGPCGHAIVRIELRAPAASAEALGAQPSSVREVEGEIPVHVERKVAARREHPHMHTHTPCRNHDNIPHTWQLQASGRLRGPHLPVRLQRHGVHGPAGQGRRGPAGVCLLVHDGDVHAGLRRVPGPSVQPLHARGTPRQAGRPAHRPPARRLPGVRGRGRHPVHGPDGPLLCPAAGVDGRRVPALPRQLPISPVGSRHPCPLQRHPQGQAARGRARARLRRGTGLFLPGHMPARGPGCRVVPGRMPQRVPAGPEHCLHRLLPVHPARGYGGHAVLADRRVRRVHGPREAGLSWPGRLPGVPQPVRQHQRVPAPAHGVERPIQQPRARGLAARHAHADGIGKDRRRAQGVPRNQGYAQGAAAEAERDVERQRPGASHLQRRGRPPAPVL